MNSFYEMLLKRRTIRSFQPRAIPDETMDQILLAGRYAPSGMGLQNRHFTVVQDPGLMKEIVAATEKAGGKFVPGHTPFYGAPDVVVLSAPKDFKLNREDAACAAENLLLAAYAFGIGSCYICSVVPGLRDESILKRLNLPRNYIPFGCVALGFPAQGAPGPKARRTDDVTWIRV